MNGFAERVSNGFNYEWIVVTFVDKWRGNEVTLRRNELTLTAEVESGIIGKMLRYLPIICYAVTEWLYHVVNRRLMELKAELYRKSESMDISDKYYNIRRSVSR